MIEHIINKLLNDEDVVQKYNLNGSTISYVQTSTSPYRNYLHARFTFTIFSDASPVLCVKFYSDKNSNVRLEKEYDIQRTIYAKYENLKIPRPLALLEINEQKVMVEEAFDGKTLYKHWEDNMTPNNYHENIKYATEVQMRLNQNLTRSNLTDLTNEINALTSQFITLYRPTPAEEAAIMKLLTLLIDQFKNESIYKRFTNGDFSPWNILLNVRNEPVLLDFERAEETHLYFLEWFNFIFTFNIPRQAIESIINDNCDIVFVNALSYIKNLNHVSNSQLVKAQWLLFHMKELVGNSQAYPKESEIQRITMKSKLKTLFTGSNVRTQELIRLGRVSLFILRTGGIKIFYHAIAEKIRTNGLLRTLLATQ